MSVNPEQYFGKYPGLTDTQVKDYANYFNVIDADKSGQLDASELQALFKELGAPITLVQAKSFIAAIDLDGNGQCDFAEFLSLISGQTDNQEAQQVLQGIKKHIKSIQIQSKSGSISSYTQEEVAGYSQYLNLSFKDEPRLAHIIPINPDDDTYFKAFSDGTLLCMLCNLAKPDTIDERAIKFQGKKKLNVFQINENIQLGLSSSKAIGMKVIGIQVESIREGVPGLVLGLTWQLIKAALMKNITLNSCPELYRLLEEGETLEQLLKLSPEELLLRWLNYHLKKAGSERRAHNFEGDLADSEIMTIVLNQIAPTKCNLSPMQKTDLVERAAAMLNEADKIDCYKFVTPKEFAKGNKNLNTAFVANVFNTCPGLEELTQEELSSIDDALFKSAGSPLERQYALWMNSFGVEPFVMNLFDDIADGLVLLQLFDKMKPGCVNWKLVAKTKMNRFKATANCDQCVQLGKDFGFSLVGVGGVDIYDKNQLLTMSLLWQMMRFDYVRILKVLGGGEKIKDQEIVKWANGLTAGKCSIKSFKDDALQDSIPILTLLDVVKPNFVDWSLISHDLENKDEMIKNARYLLSILRQLGCSIFCLPEDVYNHAAQTIMPIYASIMYLASEH